MLKTLSIRNFRCFDQFEMHDLGRVNLLVGTNNSGKTSVLEAIELLCSHGSLRSIWAAGSRRGETLANERDHARQEIAVRHLFRGHSLAVGNAFSIEAKSDGRTESVTGQVDEGRETSTSTINATTTTPPPSISIHGQGASPSGTNYRQSDLEFEGIETWEQPLDFNLCWKTGTHTVETSARLTAQGCIEWRSARGYSRLVEDNARVARLITTASVPASEAVSLWDKIVLTEEEKLVVSALGIIDPAIRRIAAISTTRTRMLDADERGGFLISCEGIAQPIPIGSMGDGIWRMLGLALAIVRAKNGVLLVDEIDTGLHYSVMVDMWRMVAETAKRLNVQVFAATHSRDCYESLAAVANEGVAEGSEVTIQRIERKKGRAVAYTEQEIVAAAEHGVEVR